MTYEPLLFTDFSRNMVLSKDLDPVYVAAKHSLPDPDQRDRWLLAYGLFYHIGAASYFSEFQEERFWDLVAAAALNEQSTPVGGRWPRASERRHFRGQFAVRCVEELRTRHPRPETFMEGMISHAPDVRAVRGYVESHTGFGGWASFKFADLVDRVVGRPVEFDTDTAFYDTPIKGAHLLYRERFPESVEVSNQTAVSHAVEVMGAEMLGLMAPPFGDRPIALNELETCLCKFKSHIKGRYPIGKDLHEGLEMTSKWRKVSCTAEEFHQTYRDMMFEARAGGWMQ